MEAHETEAILEVVTKYFSLLGERSIELIMGLLSDQLDWYIPGNETIAPWLGLRTNRNEVKEVFELLWKNTEPVSATIDHIAIDGNVVICSGSFVTRMVETEKLFKSLFFTEITVVKGLIVKYRLLEDTFGLVKALSK